MASRSGRRVEGLLAGLAAVALALCACGENSREPEPTRTPIPTPTADPTPEPTPEATPSLDPRTVGYWRFEEGTPDVVAVGEGAIRDSSPSADHGTPFGGPRYLAEVPRDVIPQTHAPNSLSLRFDTLDETLDDNVFFASRFLLNEPGDATIEFWINHPGDDHQAVIWGRPNNDDLNRFHIYVNADRTWGADYRDPTGRIFYIVPSIPFPPNVWTHLAITRSGTTYRGYRDGILVSTITDPEPKLPTSIGWRLAGRKGWEFAGRVDELRLVRAALSPEEFLNASPKR